MNEQLTILLVVVPLMIAPITALFKSHTISWILTAIVSFTSLILSFIILFDVIDGSHVIYELGGWRPSLGH